MSHVNIVTPAHNAADTVAETIESVLAQTLTSWSYWIVDDGSSDDTARLAERYTSDPRVHLIRQRNRGAAHARNAGIDHAVGGDFIAFLDADDRWHADFLRSLTTVLEADPGVGLVWSDMSILGTTGATYRGRRPPIEGEPGDTLEPIFRSVTFLPSCALFRQSFFDQGLRWRQDCSPMEDMPIFFAVAGRSAVRHVDRILADYRIHEGSSTSSRGAIGRNYPAMVHTFRDIYLSHRDEIPRRAYRERMWYIHHHAADNRIREGRSAYGLLLRALRHRPTALVSWKVLTQSLLCRFQRRISPGEIRKVYR